MLRIEAQPDILARSDLSSRRFILAPASVQRHKNIGVLLEAAEFLESSDVLLVLYGSAGAAEFKAAGLTLGPNVRLVGRVNDGEMKSLMQAATAFAFPSTTEGFGLPPLEAMLMGAPAIVAPRGPLPALCGDAVLYADPGEGAAWAEAITTLLEDEPKRLALSEAGRRRAAGYRWADAADLLQETILEVLGADGRRAVTA
jgi:glycosyltransferase involved in cell wall biosynthesis